MQVLLAAGASPSHRRLDGLTPMIVGLICRPSEEDLEVGTLRCAISCVRGRMHVCVGARGVFCRSMRLTAFERDLIFIRRQRLLQALDD